TVRARSSAGPDCWFAAPSTASFGPLAPLAGGLGCIAGSACPPDHGAPGRAESVRAWISTGQLPGPGAGIDDHAAVVFEDTAAASVLVEAPEARAYVVDQHGETPGVDEFELRRLDLA